MKKLIRRRIKLIIMLCIALSIGGVIFIGQAAMAETPKFYFYYTNSGETDKEISISEYTIEKQDMIIHLNSTTGMFSTDQIEWYSEDESVLTVKKSVGSQTSADIKCLKPGTSKVYAEIRREIDGKEQIFNAVCIFTVRLAINDYINVPDNQGHILHLFEEDAEDSGSLVIDVGESFPLTLKIGQAQAQDLSWTSLNKNIAQIDNAGRVIGIQPGIAKILAQTYDLENQNNILQSDYIYVVVKPKFKNSDGNPVPTLSVSNPEVLHTNISDYIITDEDILPRTASEFAWIVKNADTSEVLVDTYKGKTSNLVSITPSKVDGSVAIDCKSGNYEVMVYPLYPKDPKINVMEADDYPLSKAKITEYVDINLLTQYDYVQVNDVWDIYKASNIFNVANDFDITVQNCEYDKLKGTITFTKEGLALVQFKKKVGSDLPLDNSFQNNVLTMLVNVKPYTVQDKTIRVKKGGTEQISVTDYGYDPSVYGTVYQYEFVSNNLKIATVFSNTPKTAEVTGVKEGVTTVDCIISYDNGIIRKLTTKVIVWKKISATLDKKTAELMIDQQIAINATYPKDVNPESDINIKWVNVTNSPSDSPIKIVNNEDTNYKTVGILGVKEGVATIALRDMNDGEDLAICTITVVKSTTISFGKTDYDVVLDKGNTAGNKLNLDLLYSPKTPDNPRVEWTSSNPSVATVTNGVVTYKSAGYTYIKAVYYMTDNLTTSASCRINVFQKIDKISIQMVTKGPINNGDEIVLKAIYSPTNYIQEEDKVLSWETNNTGIIKISGNNEFPTVKAIGPGKATITVKTTSGKSATVNLEVIQKPTNVQFADKSITMDVGSSKNLSVILSPANTTENKLTYSSDNEEYLKVDDKGFATAISAGDNGKATVWVSVKTENEKTARIKVTIIQRVKDMQLNYAKKTIAKGSTFSLKPIFTPNTANNKKVKYAIANGHDKSIATVSASGVVTGKKGGVTMISCTSEDTGITAYCLVIVEEKVTTVTLNKTSYVIGLNKTYTLKASVKSNFASNKKVKWTSSNSKIVSVSSKGVIKGKKIGYATITVTALDGSGAYATCRVRVINQMTSLKLNKASAKMIEGSTLKLTATIKPSNATLKSLSWASSNEDVAYVDSVGKVYAVKKGRCKITVKAKDGSGKSATCIIEVIEDKPVSSITIMNRNITMIVGENTTMKYYVAPKNHTDTIRWSSDDSKIVSINSKTGKMKARRAGTATITAYASSGKATTTTVTVVGLTRTTLKMEQYDTYQLRVLNGRGVQWVSSNQRVVNVTATGKLSARKKGTSYVTAIVNGRRIKCKVTVVKIK